MPEPATLGDGAIAYWVGTSQPLAFQLHEVTPQGALLESRILWEIGEELSLELWFPGEVRHRAKARVKEGVSAPIMGVRLTFIDLDPSAAGALGRYLARQSEPAQEA